jgi:large subunit ribosomal protein L33
MAKGKGARIIVTLECTECRTNVNKAFSRCEPLHHYQKPPHTPGRLELRKYCPKCNRHTLHKEIK